MPDHTKREAAAAADLEAKIVRLLTPLSDELRAQVAADLRAGRTSERALRAFMRKWRAALRTPAMQEALIAAAQRAARISAQRLKAVDPTNKRLALAVDAFSGKRLADSAQAFARRNARLVTRVGRRQQARIADLARDALRTGRAMEDVEKDLAKVLGPRDSLQRRNIRLLARNEVTTLSADITRQRHEALGVKRERWSSSKDQRVRSEHQANDGKIYNIATGIRGERPGEAIGCRCVAVPVLPPHLTKK